MNVAEILLSLQQIAGRLANDGQQPPELVLRTRAVAELLRTCCPGADVCACVLLFAGVAEFVVVGSEQEENAWRERLDPRRVPAGADLCDAWTEHFRSAGERAVVQPIEAEQGSLGVLCVLMGSGQDAADRSATAAVTAAVASILAVQLRQDALGRENELLREACVDAERLACVGEIAGPLTHEFTNFLNALLLKATVLAYQLPDHHRSDLVEIRSQGLLAAEAVSRFFQYRRLQSDRRLVDVNRMVMEIANEFATVSPAALPVRVLSASSSSDNEPQNTISLALALAPDLPLAQSVPTDLRRLIRFLLANAVRAAVHLGKRVMVETRNDNGRAILVIDDTGPTPTSEDLLRLFDISRPNREGVDALELAASWSIARRLRCEIRSEARFEGGLRLRVAIDVAY